MTRRPPRSPLFPYPTLFRSLRSLVEISKVIALAALRRENSRGAHYREDFPGEGDLATSTFTVARQRGGVLDIANEPVQFTLRSEEHTSELQSQSNLVCRLLL